MIDLEVMQVHVCRDVATGKKFKIQRIQRADGTEIARPLPDFSKSPPSTLSSVKETSWQEHLRAIREEKRELLGVETGNSYTYEMLLDDGTKTCFNHGGDAPLDRTDVIYNDCGGHKPPKSPEKKSK